MKVSKKSGSSWNPVSEARALGLGDFQPECALGLHCSVEKSHLESQTLVKVAVSGARCFCPFPRLCLLFKATEDGGG